MRKKVKHIRGDSFLELSPDAIEVFQTKTHSGVLCNCSGREELLRLCLDCRGQRPKQNNTQDWKGHMTARDREVGRWSHSIQGQRERGRGECIWWSPRNRSQLFPSYSSPDIFVFTLYITNTPLLHKPSPMNIPITEFTILSWLLYHQQMEKVKVFLITHLSGGLSYEYAFGIFLESFR